ncbi:MAG: hypothetical protein GQ574_09500 [Crocinitomix sp.]|nr:hypothetical protein [Crocinitomix sp.]
MNPKQNFRGPSSIDATSFDTSQLENVRGNAYQSKTGTYNSNLATAPAVQRTFIQSDRDDLDNGDVTEKASPKEPEVKAATPEPKTAEPKTDEKKEVKEVSTPCKTTKMAATFPTNTNIADNSLSGFGDTKRLAAGFSFGACKIGKNWRFHLKTLSIPIKVVVRAANFKIGAREWKNIETAQSGEINKANVKNVIYNLSPNKTRTFQAKCSGVAYPQTVSNYPKRIGFWNQKITTEHEEFHKAEWSKTYKAELIKAEDKIVDTVKLPTAAAKNEKEAITAMRKTMDAIMIAAYVNATKLYCPNREINAYNRDAPKYKSLITAIKARGKKEKW